MTNAFQQIRNAAKQLFAKRRYVFIFLSFALFFFALFVFIPVKTIPGNSLAFQLSLFRPQDYLLMALLAFLAGLNFSMNIYVWRRNRSVSVPGSVASGAGAGLGGVFATVVGSATCASCLASLFGVVGLGFGAVSFILEYQTFFLLGAIALVVLSLYFTARKISKHCVSCNPQ